MILLADVLCGRACRTEQKHFVRCRPGEASADCKPCASDLRRVPLRFPTSDHLKRHYLDLELPRTLTLILHSTEALTSARTSHDIKSLTASPRCSSASTACSAVLLRSSRELGIQIRGHHCLGEGSRFV